MTTITGHDWTLFVGDCREGMAALPPESVDAIVTDPPYGLGFMGKGWDHAVPGMEFWVEALRVAKPGAHLLAFGGTRTFHRLTVAIEDAGWEIRDCLSWLYGSGFPKSHNGPWGGTALKPAWEPIVLARKPLVGTVAANVEAHGTGGLNIDGCRIGTDGGYTNHTRLGGESGNWIGNVSTGERTENGGRWPANLVLDEAAAALLDAQTGEITTKRIESPSEATRGGGSGFSSTFQTSRGARGYSDTGGASRFFYTAKASRSEREAGLDGVEKRDSGTMQDDGYKWERDGKGNPINLRTRAANHHPTVKPIDLMRWLVRLVCPRGGLVLDPFAGSGTTGVAALLESMRFTGCEITPEYAEIARHRLAHALATHQPDLGL